MAHKILNEVQKDSELIRAGKTNFFWIWEVV